MTNGEKLRQMSDEELLKFFFGMEASLIMMVFPVTQTRFDYTESYAVRMYLLTQTLTLLF